MSRVFRVIPWMLASLLGPVAQAGLAPDITAARAPDLRPCAQCEHHDWESLATPVTYEEQLYFSGIGAIACTADQQRVTATAFFVGAFDVLVTVAEVFEHGGDRLDPAQCVYVNTDAEGQIREEIPLAYVKLPQHDGLAVVRLASASVFARRTLPFGKFDGQSTRAYVVAFEADLEQSTRKMISHGVVQPTGLQAVAGRSEDLFFTQDAVIPGLAAGAPVIDERTGTIIGVYASTLQTAARNRFIAMDDWLETTLRSELEEGL